jgi:dipeptidyl aminopeptidase/acylaminoacyl peptidase
VAAGNPAVLTFQGTKDPLVPDHHARKLHEALKQAGVPEKLVLLEGVGHDPNSGSEAQKAQVLLEMNSFLTAHLKAKAER